MNNETEHWLRQVLFGFQSSEESERAKAWTYIAKMTGKEPHGFASLADAIAQVYTSYCNDKEKEEFLLELARLIPFSKKYGLSVESMDTLLLLVALIDKMDAFAEMFARSFMFAWRNAKERNILAHMFLSSLSGVGESMGVYQATMCLVQKKWMPRQYAVDACSVLLASNPRAWFNTMAMMMPRMSRHKNKLMRSWDQDRKIWRSLEVVLLGEIKLVDLD